MSEHPHLSNPFLWSIPYHGRDRALIDPVKRGPLKTNEVPLCVKEDELLYGGLQFLVDRGQAIRLDTLYTRHVADEDLDMGWRGRFFERSVRRADYFGYESYPGPIKLVAEMGVNQSGYKNRVRRAIDSCDPATKCFPMDIAGVNSSPLERSIIEALTVFLEGYIDFESYTALCGIENVREWVMLARLGLALQEREGEKVRKPRIFSLFGRGHQDLTRKAQLLGLQATATIIGQFDFSQEAQTARTGVVPYSHYVKLNKPIDQTEED